MTLPSPRLAASPLAELAVYGGEGLESVEAWIFDHTLGSTCLETTVLDVLRTLLLAGVGAIDVTDEKMRSIIDELRLRGELAADEARELTALWATRAQGRRDAVAERVRSAVDDALARQNVASHASVADLQARVEALEQAVARLAEPPVES